MVSSDQPNQLKEAQEDSLVLSHKPLQPSLALINLLLEEDSLVQQLNLQLVVACLELLPLHPLVVAFLARLSPLNNLEACLA